MLWARANYKGFITFEYGLDPDFSSSREGSKSFKVDDPDIPVKYPITGLSEGTQYYYRVCKGEVCSFSGLHVLIDIKPDSDPNSVNPRSKGVIPVTILGSIDFDVKEVDYSTLTFGPGEATLAHNGHVEDVNDDGFMDDVFHFRTQETGIVCGDTEATLNGELFDETPIMGTDSVNTVGCKGTSAESNGTSAEIQEKEGKFSTAKANGHNGLRFGVSSCFRGDLRPFQSISNVPESNLDFFVSVGDTAYADSADGDGPDSIDADGQAVVLSQFRKKYMANFSQLDNPDDIDNPDNNYFAKLRASTAIYATIDDHEVVDNFSGGAHPSTHKEITSCKLAIRQARNAVLKGEDLKSYFNVNRCLSFCNDDINIDKVNGDDIVENPSNPNCNVDFINDTSVYEDGLEAWHDYNPVHKEKYGQTGDARTAGEYKLYRYRTFGADAAMFVLDTRSFRDEASLLLKSKSNRTILGKVQLEELFRDLRNADDRGITWKFIMVSVPIQDLGLDNSLAGSQDRFEGYAFERYQILDFIETECIDNVVFVSGDIHASIVNNLTYETPLDILVGLQPGLDPQRFSYSWDISTGPGAYPDLTAVKLTRSEAGDAQGPLDKEFKRKMDLQLALFNRPWTGLGFEIFQATAPLQQRNRNIPATLLEGDSYVSGHSYGWTEFDIKANTQKLTVTTYGIPWYEPGTESTEQPAIINKFEVDPFIPSKEGENCFFDTDCVTCRCATLSGEGLLKCDAKKENGSFCAIDSQCVSGRCAGVPLVCQDKLPNGSSCVFDVDCNSNRCVGVPPFAECQAKLPTGASCTFNVDCSSDSCTNKLRPIRRTCD